MPTWKCEDCGSTVEAPQEPDQCPCGSENISEVGSGESLLNSVKSMLGLN